MTELVVIRHGETDWNRQHRFQGQVDVPLNAAGHAQARRVAERLAAERADVLLTSDLRRARETAAPLAQSWALPPLADAGWREQNFGEVDGLEVAQVQRDHPALWAAWAAQQADAEIPGGESIRQFHARVLGAVDQVLQVHRGKRVAMVTHGGVLDVLWRHAQGLPLSGTPRCPMPNGGINRLAWQDGRWQVLQWAEAGHLAGLNVLDPGRPAGATIQK
jgi:probable phosphoglycerate mutase